MSVAYDAFRAVVAEIDALAKAKIAADHLPDQREADARKMRVTMSDYSDARDRDMAEMCKAVIDKFASDRRIEGHFERAVEVRRIANRLEMLRAALPSMAAAAAIELGVTARAMLPGGK